MKSSTKKLGIAVYYLFCISFTTIIFGGLIFSIIQFLNL